MKKTLFEKAQSVNIGEDEKPTSFQVSTKGRTVAYPQTRRVPEGKAT